MKKVVAHQVLYYVHHDLFFDSVTFAVLKQCPDSSGAVPWSSWPVYEPVIYCSAQKVS